MRTLALLMLAFPLATLAQTVDIPKSAMDGLSRDLGNLQRAVIEAQREHQSYEKVSAMMGTIAVTERTPIRAGASDTAPTLFEVMKGKTFDVVARRPGWYAVKTDQMYQGTSTGWVPETVAVSLQQDPPPSMGDRIFARMTMEAALMKQKYDNNPYFTVTGFTVSVLPPSVSMNFEFKTK